MSHDNLTTSDAIDYGQLSKNPDITAENIRRIADARIQAQKVGQRELIDRGRERSGATRTVDHSIIGSPTLPPKKRIDRPKITPQIPPISSRKDATPISPTLPEKRYPSSSDIDEKTRLEREKLK